MRTAAVSLNILNIIFTIVVAVVLSILFAVQSGPVGLRDVLFVLLGALVMAGVSGLGLWSAMNWNLTGVLATAILFGAILIWRIINLEWVDIAVTALLLYPHVVLYIEMKSGVLTPETYDQEEYIAEGGRDFVDMAHEYISPQNSMA